jgi:hypothetical protein
VDGLSGPVILIPLKIQEKPRHLRKRISRDMRYSLL